MIGGVPRRVDAATKSAIIELIDQAIEEGWTARRAATVLGVGELRLRRWRARRDRLDDLASGGNPVHGLLAGEVEEILALAEEWGRGRPQPPQAGPSRFLPGPGVGRSPRRSCGSWPPPGTSSRSAAGTHPL